MKSVLVTFFGLVVAVLALAQAPAPPLNLNGFTDAGAFDGPAELPRVYINSSLANTPAPGSVITLAAGGNLQTALNNLQCGQTLQLAAGSTWSGKFTFPVKNCDDSHWMIVRTSAPDSSLPAEGTRINPCYAGVASLPGRPAFTCPVTSSVMATIKWTGTGGSGPLVFAAGANHYRLIGVEISRSSGTGSVGTMVQPASGVNHIGFDRLWVHGTAQDETNNGIGFTNEQYIFIVDSYMNDFHCTSVIGTCTDAHPIGGGLDTIQSGTFKIHNNFLEGAGQEILFGGGPASTTPSDIEITQNHLFKPMIWLAGQPGFVGGVNTNTSVCTTTPGQCPFIVKNHFELKNAQRVLFEGNILENVWGGFTQVGFSILLTPKNQNGNCPACLVQDVTIRYNKISHSGAGISLANAPSDTGAIATAGQRYSIHDITNDDINATLYNGAGGTFQISNGFPTPLNSIKIDHVTAFPDYTAGGKYISLGGGTTNVMYGFQFTNSIFSASKFPIWSTGGTTNCAISNVPLSSLNTCFPGGYTFTNNVFIANSNFPPASWPAGQFFPATTSAIQFVNYNNGNGGDYHLLVTSPYKNAGTDGKDLGADIDAINAKTQNAF